MLQADAAQRETDAARLERELRAVAAKLAAGNANIIKIVDQALIVDKNRKNRKIMGDLHRKIAEYEVRMDKNELAKRQKKLRP